LTNDWLKDWIANIPWERDEEAVLWLKSRPESIKRLLLRFPPSCVVSANRNLKCPAPGGFGIVTSLLEPDETHSEGMLTVRDGPDGNIRHQCKPEWLIVIGYWHGLTPEVVSYLLEN